MKTGSGTGWAPEVRREALEKVPPREFEEKESFVRSVSRVTTDEAEGETLQAELKLDDDDDDDDEGLRWGGTYDIVFRSLAKFSSMNGEERNGTVCDNAV